MDYPFIPKSTVKMKRGQFWPIRLPNAKYACGMVLDVVHESRTSFLAGLLDWTSSEKPTREALIGVEVQEQGVGHIKMIIEAYGEITGELV